MTHSFSLPKMKSLTISFSTFHSWRFYFLQLWPVIYGLVGLQGTKKCCCVVSLAAAGVPGQRQGGGFDGLHLRHGSLWKNQEGLWLLRDSQHPESHLSTQRSGWNPPHQSRIRRCVFICDCSRFSFKKQNKKNKQGLHYVFFFFHPQVMVYPQFLWR